MARALGSGIPVPVVAGVGGLRNYWRSLPHSDNQLRLAPKIKQDLVRDGAVQIMIQTECATKHSFAFWGGGGCSHSVQEPLCI